MYCLTLINLVLALSPAAMAAVVKITFDAYNLRDCGGMHTYHHDVLANTCHVTPDWTVRVKSLPPNCHLSFYDDEKCTTNAQQIPIDGSCQEVNHKFSYKLVCPSS
ncbi:hypothetical protein M3J09_003635 [Ascochyta lentis]